MLDGSSYESPTVSNPQVCTRQCLLFGLQCLCLINANTEKNVIGKCAHYLIQRNQDQLTAKSGD